MCVIIKKMCEVKKQGCTCVKEEYNELWFKVKGHPFFSQHQNMSS
jgi:hypothetical protein